MASLLRPVAKGFTNIVSPSRGVICLEGAVTLVIKDGEVSTGGRKVH